MEAEIRNMQMELANVHRERQQLEQQRKLLKCTGPCAPCSCCPPGSSQSSAPGHQPMMVPCLTGSSFPPNQQAIPEASLNYPVSMAAPKVCRGKCENISEQKETSNFNKRIKSSFYKNERKKCLTRIEIDGKIDCFIDFRIARRWHSTKTQPRAPVFAPQHPWYSYF